MIDYFLFSTLKNSENFWTDVLLILILFPLLKKINFEPLLEYIKPFFRKKEQSILLKGYNSMCGELHYTHYPDELLALCHYISSKDLTNKIRMFSTHSNKKDEDSSFHLIDDIQNLKIDEDIYLDFTNEKDYTKEKKKNHEDFAKERYSTVALIKSNKKDIKDLKNFIKNITADYESYKQKMNKTKLYHFIFNSYDKTEDFLSFSCNMLSDLENESHTNYETFDTLFSEHKDGLIKSIDRLKDFSYYRRTGMKRKLGYLFYGPPGCGKTSHVVAMANYDQRHIIEIPMSRVKTNYELEKILTVTKLHGKEFKKSEIIIIFDEIDQAKKAVLKRDSESEEEVKEEENNNIIINTKNTDTDIGMLFKTLSKNNVKDANNDALNLGFILSRLDGIGNYDGLIIVATTNCKDELSPALYRHGRLAPLFFNYATKSEIIGMIERFYDRKLTIEEKDKIVEKKCEHAYFRKLLEDYENNFEGLIQYLSH